MADIRQTEKYSEYLEKIGWKVEKTGQTYSYIKNFPLVGSVIKIQRPEEIDIEAFGFVIKKHKALQTVIEPKLLNHKPLLTNYGFRLSRNPYLPTKTLHLDLTKSIESLFSQLAKDAKYSLRKTANLKIYAVTDTKGFRESWKKAAGFRRWVPPKEQLDAMIDTFKEDRLLLVTPGGESGAIFLRADEGAYYWQAFSNKKGRLGLYQYKIVWAGINWAKGKGSKFFDFEGIYDTRFPNKRWLGFTHFKKSFGGYVVEYPGAYTKYPLLDIIRSKLR